MAKKNECAASEIAPLGAVSVSAGTAEGITHPSDAESHASTHASDSESHASG